MKSPSLTKSFAHAWRGIRLCFKMERSFRIQLLIALVVCVAATVFPLEIWKRIAVAFVIMSVLVLELLNSSIERLVDLVKPRLHDYVADIKDLMAAAVLLASCVAVVVGIVIFWPYLFQALRYL